MRAAVDAIVGGRVVAAATETFFALLADATNPRALDRLFAMKPRAEGVALILPRRAAWSSLVLEIPPLAGRLADAFWPGPLTIALAAAESVDPRLTVAGTVGVRIAGKSPAADLAAAVDRPLTATSANPHGVAPPTDDGAVKRFFAEKIASGDLLVLPGTCAGGAPSTIVAIANDEMAVVRHGAVTEDQIRGKVGSPK